MSRFTRNIAPYVQQELGMARVARSKGECAVEFHHLENAHVLGQESTWHHTRVHCLMLLWGIRQKSAREIFGQALRIVGALGLTAVGLVPMGNTGGSNISPFKKLPLSANHAAIIAQAKNLQ